MLNFKQKVSFFTSILEKEEKSYADSFNAEILLCASNFDFRFLKQMKSLESIESRINHLKSEIVMKEDEDDFVLEDIMNEYTLRTF